MENQEKEKGEKERKKVLSMKNNVVVKHIRRVQTLQ